MVGDTKNLQMNLKEIIVFQIIEHHLLHHRKFDKHILSEKIDNLTDIENNIIKIDGNNGSHTEMTGQQIDV